MKQAFAFLVGAVLCVTFVRAGDVKVEAYMTNNPKDEAATIFAADNPKLYAMFKAKGTKDGDKIRGVLIAEDVGDAAPANTKVLEKTLDVEGESEGRDFSGDFNFSKPTTGWPVGKYRVEICVNEELATTAKFTIKASTKPKNEAKDEEEEESGD